MNKHLSLLKIFLAAVILFTAFNRNLTANPANKGKELDVVVIDPGHGGKDAGAIVRGVKEKDIVLGIALMVGNYIKKNYPNIKVIYTRDKDIFIPLYKRAEIANKNKAGLFISIHANYVGSKSVEGTETFVLGEHRSKDNLEVAKKENSVILLEDNYSTKYEGFDPNVPESYIMFSNVQDAYLEQSLDFAAAVQGQFKERAKRIDRGVKQAGFLVLRETTMPSVLIEVGFISHAAERSFLISKSGQSYIASAIYRSFREYKDKIEAKSNFILNVGDNGTTGGAVIKQPGLEAPAATQGVNIENGIWFTIQLAATRKLIKVTAENFRGEKNIYWKHIGGIYKYYSGKFDRYEKAIPENARIKSKFPDAFIVAFNKDKPIPLKKALRKNNQTNN
ncbi:MAG: N-acetylmuramoyl-L-alanine amidase [Chlorobi bacterium]|nr:N-acetylmuramoyl-L-alanine amidase [Chlorobiota bacterium]